MSVSIKRCVEGFGSKRSSDSSLCNQFGGGLFALLDGRVRSVRLIVNSGLEWKLVNSSTAGCFLCVGNRPYGVKAKGSVGTDSANSGSGRSERDCIHNVPQRG